jgi:hypothetical protein
MQCDLTDPQQTGKLFTERTIDAVVNTAALSQPAECEANPAAARWDVYHRSIPPYVLHADVSCLKHVCLWDVYHRSIPPYVLHADVSCLKHVCLWEFH